MTIKQLMVWFLGGVVATPLVVFTLGKSATAAKSETPAIIGPTAEITEVMSGVEFLARVDTGAAVSSIHCKPEDVQIENESENPAANLNKRIRVRLVNRDGKRAWITTTIDDYVEVRNAEHSEHRYRIRLPLRYRGVQKSTVVNLNDRSRMTYRMLLGRDFLKDHFVVDVSDRGMASL